MCRESRGSPIVPLASQTTASGATTSTTLTGTSGIGWHRGTEPPGTWGGGEIHMLEMIMSFVYRIREREEGQALVEYALILSLVSIASILVLGALGTSIGDTLQTVVDAL